MFRARNVMAKRVAKRRKRANGERETGIEVSGAGTRSECSVLRSSFGRQEPHDR